uniref:Mast cell immunoglobulin like receptor 1 n=1 Tax=Propithecus coquereli TaxID=379532 RepID=A0A2K6EWU5_PROCO
MRSHLNTLLFWGTFSSVTSQNAVLDCGTMKTDEFPSPRLYSETNVVMKGQNVSLFCFNENKSLQITYSLFRHGKYLGTQNGTGKPVIFNLNISEVPDSGPYKCKAEVLQCGKYSRELNFTIVGGGGCPFCLQLLLPGLLLMLTVTVLILAFWILPKYKARKAMRHNVPKDRGEVGIYANISNDPADEASVPDVESRQCVSTAQDGAGDAQEIHYATPMFWEVAPIEQEACNDYKPGCVYSELVI